jgi:hypothetical protein
VNDEPDNPPVLTEEPDSGLDARQERMILALLEHPTNEKAAAALGISAVTLWRATKKPEFAEAFRKARREAFSQSVARLQHASNAAVGTLLRVMTDREAPAASRVRAADVVLQAALRGMEMEDIEARVSELERVTEANKGGQH